MSRETVLDAEKDGREPGSSPVDGEVVDAEAAPDPEVRQEQGDSSARRRFLVVGAVSLVVIAGLAAALIVSQVQLSNQNSLAAERTSAVAAAKVFAHDVATYSYRHATSGASKASRRRRSGATSSGRATAYPRCWCNTRRRHRQGVGGGGLGRQHRRQPHRGHAGAQRRALVVAGPEGRRLTGCLGHRPLPNPARRPASDTKSYSLRRVDVTTM
jgi:hypothetical protein